MPVTVRTATPDDEAAVVSLWHACGLVIPANDPAADFRFARGQPSSDVLVGDGPDGRIAGSVMVGHDGHRGWIYYVATSPDARGLGIGRSMIAAAETWLRDRGISKVQLMVRDTNTAVVGFYERLGYAVAPRVVMSKRLDDEPDRSRAP